MKKTCSKCNFKKDIEYFYKNKTKKDGFQSECKDCTKIMQSVYGIKYRKINEHKIKSYQSNYRKTNADKLSIFHAKNYVIHISEIKKRTSKYRENNKDKYAALEAKRRAAKLNATPKWLTKQDLDNMERIYTYKNWLQETFGILLHVDHIVPLQGKNVSGLHVPWNLQILTESKNCKKSNKYGPINF